MENQNKTTEKIIFKGCFIEVDVQTVYRNFNLARYGKVGALQRSTYEDYLAKLKQGKVSYFNPELLDTFPSIIFEDDMEYKKVKQFCISNRIAFTAAELSLLNVTRPILMISSGLDVFIRVKDFCIANDIYFAITGIPN